ncbi:hypothetical protein ElyMa_001869100 [Elysia marginata]|uniref:Mutator-like transposase domain-containing protein n=1 Tax=Elysia marginata TaxID=1093978 RepID=A0AAV4EN68_9GAST|nr:hypothetical protein ElyMa_001869100 [Elysia marginata]
MPKKTRCALQLKEARAAQERRRTETAEAQNESQPSTSQETLAAEPQPQHQAAPQPIPEPPSEPLGSEYWELRSQPVIQPHPEAQASRQVEPQPSTSQGETGLNIPFHPPRTPSPVEEVKQSTSERKLSLFPNPVAGNVGRLKRTVIDLTQIEKLIRDLRCHHCLSDNGLVMETPVRYGLSVKLLVTCGDCWQILSTQYTSARNERSTSTPKPFAINEDITMSSLLAGMGPYSLRNFCEYLELPGIHPKTFNTIAKRIYRQGAELEENIFSKAAALVRQEHSRQYHLQLEGNDVLDISVSYDGSWLTCEHKSLIGIGCVIDVLTGLVIDGHVLSLHCHICARTGTKIKRETPHRYDDWFQQHKNSGECTTNFDGSSGMMEVKIAEILWSRSVERHGLRYTIMVSDGDSKAFNRLLEVELYGPDVYLSKEDCMNDVGKRFGTALHNLVADSSKRGITLGGRGHGRLTGEAIRKLQIYYARAIRGNKTAEEMRRAILASVHHGYSTDDYPQHQFCPPGPESWCFYKQSMGQHLYPSGHKKRVHTPLDYSLLKEHLQPIYERLTSVDLLKRCERKATQNPNESFHHSVWSRCSKKNFHSINRVRFALL